MSRLRPVTLEGLSKVSSRLLDRGLFRDEEHAESFAAAGPWRIQLGEEGEIVVLSRWRDHLPYACIRGVLAAEKDVPVLVEEVCGIVAAQGFERLLSPLVTISGARSYERAGMTGHRGVLGMVHRMRTPRDAAGSVHVVELARDEDADSLLEVDAASFEPFWALDRQGVSERLAEDRVSIVRSGSSIAGFAMASVMRGAGRLDRLAVAPGHRKDGVGRSLLLDCLDRMRRDDAEVVFVTTQDDNSAARALYRAHGFRPLPEPMEMLISDRL